MTAGLYHVTEELIASADVLMTGRGIRYEMTSENNCKARVIRKILRMKGYGVRSTTVGNFRTIRAFPYVKPDIIRGIDCHAQEELRRAAHIRFSSGN